MHNYASANGSFPPAAAYDANGKPLRSWCVLILPYMDQASVFQRFHLDEAWDSPHNMPLSAQVPTVFRCPSEVMPEGLTTYGVVVDPSSMFTAIP
jgi:hypothetical protein